MQKELDYIRLLYLVSHDTLEERKAFASKLIKDQNDKMLLRLKRLYLSSKDVFALSAFLYNGFGSIPKKYNCIYDIENKSFIKVDITITFSLENFHFPSDKLVNGLRYLLVLTFDSDIPDKMKDLEKYELNKGESLNLVLCNFEDLKEVQNEMSIIYQEIENFKKNLS